MARHTRRECRYCRALAIWLVQISRCGSVSSYSLACTGGGGGKSDRAQQEAATQRAATRRNGKEGEAPAAASRACSCRYTRHADERRRVAGAARASTGGASAGRRGTQAWGRGVAWSDELAGGPGGHAAAGTDRCDVLGHYGQRAVLAILEHQAAHVAIGEALDKQHAVRHAVVQPLQRSGSVNRPPATGAPSRQRCKTGAGAQVTWSIWTSLKNMACSSGLKLDSTARFTVISCCEAFCRTCRSPMLSVCASARCSRMAMAVRRAARWHACRSLVGRCSKWVAESANLAGPVRLRTGRRTEAALRPPHTCPSRQWLRPTQPPPRTVGVTAGSTSSRPLAITSPVVLKKEI